MVGDHHRRPELAEGAQPAEQHARRGWRARRSAGSPGRRRLPGGGLGVAATSSSTGSTAAKAERAAMMRKGAATKASASTMPDEGIRQRAMGEGAERTRIAEQEQQQDAARERRQRQRELHDEAEERHGAARAAGEEIAERGCRRSPPAGSPPEALRREIVVASARLRQSAPRQSAIPVIASPATKGAMR